MLKLVNLLWICLLIVVSALAQDALPKKILYNGDTCAIYSLHQVRLMNSSWLRLDECVETNDSLNSIINKADSLVKVKEAKISQFRIATFAQDTIIQNQQIELTNYQRDFAIQESKLKWQRTKTNVTSGFVFAAIVFEVLKFFSIIK